MSDKPIKIIWEPDAAEQRLAVLLQLAGPALEELRQRWVIQGDEEARRLFKIATGDEPQKRTMSEQPENKR